MLALKLKLLLPAHIHCGLPAHVDYDYVVKTFRTLSGLPKTGMVMSFAHFWSVEKKFSKRSRFDQRTKKMQKQGKTVKQDKIISLVVK